MNILVTGGAGFIGANLVRHLLSRPEPRLVVNLDCLTYAGHLENLEGVEKDPRYKFLHADIRNKREVAAAIRDHGITHVMHLAAESHVDRSIDGPGDFVHTNVVGTFHLLEACRMHWGGEMSGRRFLHVSTDEVFGSLGSEGRFSETTAYAPNSPYSASKAASDLFVRAYGHTYGLPVVITNCSNNYGPYQFPEKLIPVVIQRVLQRRPVPVYGDGLNVRDWLHVGDHVRALWNVLVAGRDGETYCIGADNQWPNIRIVEKICDLLDGIAPHPEGGSRRLITFVRDRPGHDRRYAVDASKLTSELGWTPQYDFDGGLLQTVKWYADNQAWVKAVCPSSP